jgi:nucleoside-diphosphate-sugar epimerase
MAMESPLAINEDFNLSTSRSTTVVELAALIWRLIKGAAPLRFAHDPPFEFDVQRREPEVTKAARMLGFEASTSLEDMLGEVIPWIDAELSAGRL